MVDLSGSDISLLVEPEFQVIQMMEQAQPMPKPDKLDSQTDLQKKEADGGNVLEEVVSALNRKFLGSWEKAPKKEAKKAPAARYLPNRRFAHGNQDQKQYNIAELFSSYLGKLKTAHNIYRRHMLTEYKEKKQEEVVKVNAKPTDMTYNEVEKIITAEKMNRLMGTKIHHIGAEAKEKWEVLKLFPFYRILSMLRYQTSMT